MISSPTEQAAAVRLATGKGAVPNWEDEIANLLHIGLAESGFNNQPRLFSDLLREWLQKAAFSKAPRCVLWPRRQIQKAHHSGSDPTAATPVLCFCFYLSWVWQSLLCCRNGLVGAYFPC
ncbi:MAG: hypothetical protein R3E31_04500 [Chloroflexota bacterium]